MKLVSCPSYLRVRAEQIKATMAAAVGGRCTRRLQCYRCDGYDQEYCNDRDRIVACPGSKAQVN